jgi:multiple sugar transport system substrate-binding protein
MKKRIISMLLVSAMAVSLAAGCGTKKGGDNSQETQGTQESQEGDGSSITVLVESGSPAEALANETAADFEKETGCKVVVDAVAYTGMYDKLSTEIKAGQATHDVGCLDVVWLAAFKDAIEPINNADTSDFLPTLEESGTLDGNLLGYPMWVNAKVLIYRKDLISEDKVPKTWEEYQTLAKELAGGDMYGTTVFGSGTDAVCSFLDFACQAGAKGLVFGEDGKVNITDQAYVDALKFMVENAGADYTPADSLSTASTESQELFTNEKVAMQLNWSHQYPAAVEALGADKVGCAPMIAGSAGIGATTGPWYECVMKNSSNKEMALKYVEYMYDHNGDYMDLTLKIAGRKSVYEKAGSEAGKEHTKAVLETLSSEQSQARPMVTAWAQIEEVLVGVVESCLGGGDIESTLESAASEIEAINR